MVGVAFRPLVLGLLAGVLCAPLALRAQADLLDDPQGFEGVAGLPQEKSERAATSVVSASGYFTTAKDDALAELTIVADLAKGWHIFAIAQEPGGPIKTTIKLDASDSFRVTGDFEPSPPPQVRVDQEFWPGLKVQEHHDRVTWRAPIELAPGVDPATLRITGAVNAQACETSCIRPTDYPFTATLAALGTYAPEGAHATIRGQVEPGVAAAGDTVKLVLSAEPQPGWFLTAASDPAPDGKAPRPTLIVIQETGGLKLGSPQPSAPPVTADGAAAHTGPVSWTIDVQVPEDTASGDYAIAGLFAWQAFSGGVTDPPLAARFEGRLPVGAARSQAPLPLTFSDATYDDAVQLAAQTRLRLAPASPTSLAWIIVLSLLGGLILNLMPCVLPVIGLKLLSFVEQAGRDRKQVLALNVWYTLGVLSVFMVLAVLSVGATLGLTNANLSWGQQFSSTAFNVAMAALVFVMALSYLGVWEIPIPGFIGSGNAAKVATREGPTGAIAKGVVTTLLATPCSGPFLGPVFGLTLEQPPAVTFLIFGCIGLGMSSPYLLMGAFPSLIRFLPKPGAWMDTFKQMMAFVLLGGSVFFFSVIGDEYKLATFALLIGLWAACWWIGRTPLWADTSKTLKAWAQGIGVAVIVGWLSFSYLTPQEALLDWQPFTKARLAELSADGKTVMVDFSADWCLNCKINLALAINRREVKEAVDANGVVTLLADWTQESPEIQSMLNSLGSNSIPVLAIFPADRPDQPIVLPDVITKGQVLKALEQAGPSRTPPAAQTAAAPAQKF